MPRFIETNKKEMIIKRKKINIIGIIPARMGSTRFPGKPLVKIKNKAMIYHVYFRTKMCKELNDVYIATPDLEIQDYCVHNNMNIIMTKDTHERASDRAAEAMLKIEEKLKQRIDIVVMVQGDEPMVFPAMISQALKPMLKDQSIQVINLTSPLKTPQERLDPNQVKVVMDKNNFALYFSREPIPSQKKTTKDVLMYRQVPIIPFRRDFLIKFNKLKPTPLEIIESIDMLRLLECGYKVKIVKTQFEIYGVDTPSDLKRVNRAMKRDALCPIYITNKRRC